MARLRAGPAKPLEAPPRTCCPWPLHPRLPPPPASDMQAPSLDWSLLDQPQAVKYICKEQVEPARVALVLGSEGLRQQREEWQTTQPEDRRQKVDPLQYLKKYHQVAAANSGTVEVVYSNIASSTGGYGRVTARGVGLQPGFICSAGNGMLRATRAALFADKYHDIDIVNAAPTILAQALLAAGIDCPRLCSYVSHRDEWLGLLMESCGVNRDQAKRLMSRLLHNGHHGR
jgi:hypothetical protein